MVHKFSIVAERNAGTPAIVPDISFGGVSDGATTFEVIAAAPVAIIRPPVLFYKIRSIASHGPAMSVNTDFRIYVKIIQQYELVGQGMTIGSNLLPKNSQAAIPVPSRDISQHLVVGFVLFQNIKHIFYRCPIAFFHGYRVTLRAGCRHFLLFGIGGIPVDLPGVKMQPVLRREGYNR